MTHTELRTQLIERIALLPDSKLEALLSYVSFLLWESRYTKTNGNGHRTVGENAVEYEVRTDFNVMSPIIEIDDRLPDHLNPMDDPILDMIGMVEHGSLAQDIDKELYDI